MTNSIRRYFDRYNEVLPLKVLADVTTVLGMTALGTEIVTNGSQVDGLKALGVVAVGCVSNIVLKNHCPEVEAPTEVLRDSTTSDNI